MTEITNIRKQAFEKSTVGKIFIAFEKSLFAFCIMLLMLVLIVGGLFLDINPETNTIIFNSDLFQSTFSDKIFFFTGIFLGVISMIFAGNGYAKSRLFWRLFPVIKSGKEKMIKEAEKEIARLNKLSKERPQELKNEIQEHKEYILETEREMNEPCPYKTKAKELVEKIEYLKS
jgi:hypothetical protein